MARRSSPPKNRRSKRSRRRSRSLRRYRSVMLWCPRYRGLEQKYRAAPPTTRVLKHARQLHIRATKYLGNATVIKAAPLRTTNKKARVWNPDNKRPLPIGSVVPVLQTSNDEDGYKMRRVEYRRVYGWIYDRNVTVQSLLTRGSKRNHIDTWRSWC